MWTGGGECEPNAACSLDDASAYFKKFFAQGRELGDGQRMSFGDIVTPIEHQPICSGVQDEPHLIGERRTTGSSIRRCDCVKDWRQQPIHNSNQRLMLHPPAEIRVPVNKTGGRHSASAGKGRGMQRLGHFSRLGCYIAFKFQAVFFNAVPR